MRRPHPRRWPHPAWRTETARRAPVGSTGGAAPQACCPATGVPGAPAHFSTALQLSTLPPARSICKSSARPRSQRQQPLIWTRHSPGMHDLTAGAAAGHGGSCQRRGSVRAGEGTRAPRGTKLPGQLQRLGGEWRHAGAAGALPRDPRRQPSPLPPSYPSRWPRTRGWSAAAQHAA